MGFICQQNTLFYLETTEATLRESTHRRKMDTLVWTTTVQISDIENCIESRHIVLALHGFKTLWQVLDSTLAVDFMSLQEDYHGCTKITLKVQKYWSSFL